EAPGRRRRAGRLRGVRALPAPLPDVPRHGGRDALAAGPHRRHAGRPLGGDAGRRDVRAGDGRVRPVPRLRAGVPLRRAVRPPDGGSAGHAGRRDRVPASLAPGGLPHARPPPPAGPGVPRPRRRPATAPDPPAPRPPRAAVAVGPPTGERVGRVALHRLRDGRLAARRAPCRAAGGGGHGHRGGPAGQGERLLRRTARPRRPARRRPPARRAGDGLHAGRRADPRRCRGLRGSPEGLRAPRRHRRGRAVLGPGARRPRVAGASARPAAGGVADVGGGGGGAGPVPPPARPAHPSGRAHGARPVHGPRGARRRGPVLRCRRRLQRPAARAGGRHPGPQGGGDRALWCRGRGQRQPRLHAPPGRHRNPCPPSVRDRGRGTRCRV
ncbi:MAG: Glycolate dehydrogenase, iron-sulfur subunit GlcF, partial [uncultured Acidimicrobiales bacterium]